MVYTGADGDQPALLFALVDWCRQIGLEVLFSGKVGEKWLFLDQPNWKFQLPGIHSLRLTADQADLFRPRVYRADARK